MTMTDTHAFGKVALLYGGQSAERPVSLQTGAAVLAALQRKGVEVTAFDYNPTTLASLIAGRFDRVFIALHGRGGEDGQVQGALQSVGLPYTGSGVLGSALAMDKWRTKLVWQALGIKTPRYQLLHAGSDLAATVQDLGLPLIIKPAAEGSTIGLTKVTDAAAMTAAYEAAAGCGSDVLAEQFVAGPEFTASILGGVALPLIRIEARSGLYDYAAKYERDDTQYICPAGLTPERERAIQNAALQAFAALGCSGWGRVDVMLGTDDVAYFLEANTVPGMTSHSLVPMAAKAAGMGFDDLVLRILATSMPAPGGEIC
jgi:D-alanine-D-alanine ligase